MTTATATAGSSLRIAALVYLLFTGMMLGGSTILAKLASAAGVNPVAPLIWSILSAACCLFCVGSLRASDFDWVTRMPAAPKR